MKDLNLLCLGCMKEKKDKGTCPHCGFNIKKYETDIYQLPITSILNGKYLIGKVLGEGGFGITYIGWDINLELPLAIKEYFPTNLATRDHDRSNQVRAFTGMRQSDYMKGKEKYVKEARVLARFCKEDGIVEVRDYFEENGTAYIVMEYLDGEDLGKRIKRLKKQGSHMEPNYVFEMMKPLIKTLSLVHQQKLVHRDISPDNIILLPDGKVKLIDFGASREYEESSEGLSVILKHGYAPVEQYYRNKEQGPWTDVYALCGTMYYAMTGQKPDSSMDRLAQDTLKSPSQLGITNINHYQERVLMKGLAVRRENRIQSMEELYRELYENNARSLKIEDEPTVINTWTEIETVVSDSGVGGGRTAVQPEENLQNSGNGIMMAMTIWGVVVVILIIVVVFAIISLL